MLAKGRKRILDAVLHMHIYKISGVVINIQP